MQAFRSINEERAKHRNPHLPEELLLMIQAHVKAEADKFGELRRGFVLSDHVGVDSLSTCVMSPMYSDRTA